MDLTPVVQIIGIFGTFLSLFVFWKMNRKVDSLKNEAFEYADDMVLKLRDFYVAEKADLTESIPRVVGSMISKPIMSQMGVKSGVSRQLGALEKDLVGQGVGAALGNPALGNMAAGLLQKHPVLASLLPMLMKGRGQGQPQQPQGGNGVGYG